MADVSIDIELVTKAFNRALKESGDKIDGFKLKVERSEKGISTSFQKIGSEAKKTQKPLFDLQQSFNSFVGNLAANLAGTAIRSIVNFTQESVKRFLAFEKALVGVQKTTNITGKELEALARDIDGLSSRIPVASTQLLNIAQTAGQLGVRGSENIIKFTDTIAKLGFATNLSGEEAATSLIRILNASGETVNEIDRLGAVIVDLGNNFAATESEIARVGTEVARSTAAFRIGSANVLGISTALKAVGVQAQLGGSVVGRSFREIDNALRTGGDSLKILTQITGQTGAQLRKTFQEDSTKVFQLFVEGLGRISRGGGSVSQALARFGLEGDEVNKILPVLAVNSDKLATALGRANTEFQNATALEREATTAFDTLGASLDRLGNNIFRISKDIGEFFAPAIKGVVDDLNLALGTSETAGEKLVRLQGLLNDARDRAPTPAEQKRIEFLETQIEKTQELLELETQRKQAEAGAPNFGAGGGLDPNAPFLPGAGTSDTPVDTGAKVDPKQSPEVQRQIAINAELARLKAERETVEEEARLKDLEQQGTITEDDFVRLQEIEARKLNLTLQAEEDKAKAIQDADTRRLKLQELAVKREVETTKLGVKQDLQLKEFQRKREETIFNLRQQAAQGFLSAGLTLAKQGSREQKALQTTTALISTYTAANQALSSPPGPPFTIPLVAAVVAQGLANVAKINSAGNFQDGGIVGGSTFSGDRITANVNAGEMILNRTQQQRLFSIANGRETADSNVQTITAEEIREIVATTVSEMQVVLVADDTEIARSASRGVDNGIVIGGN